MSSAASNRRRRSRQTTSVLSLAGFDIRVTRKPMKTMTLRISPEGEIRVSCPPYASMEDLRAFVLERQDWVKKARARVLSERQEERELWQDGSTIALWGEPLTIQLQEISFDNPRAAAVERRGDRLIVSLKTTEVQGNKIRQLVERWLRIQLERELPRVIARCEAEVGVHASSWRIRTMKTRWGSCNTRTAAITLNAELVERPLPCLEGVVTHELCHLLEPSHNAHFHALMDEHYPSWRRWRKVLNEKPPRRS